MVVSMVESGEQPALCPKCSWNRRQLRREVDNAVASMTSLLSRHDCLSGVVVGSIVIAMFLPLIAMITNLTGAKVAVPVNNDDGHPGKLLFSR